MPHKAPFPALRARAYELADTGRHTRWQEIGALLEQEGYALAVQRLRADPILCGMLDARCDQARNRNA